MNVATGAAATVCRQHQHEMGLEAYRQLNNKKHRYLTKLLKPTFDSNNFEESFSNWEFELSRCERDNSTTLPDQIKIAVLMNETSGPLQQHLRLNAGATQTYVEVRGTIMEYYRATTALSRLHQQHGSSSVSAHAQRGPAPMGKGAPKQGCCRCGQQGHIARGCKVAVHSLNEATGNTYTSNWQEEPTAQWYQQQQYYDGQWWNDDQTQVNV